MKVVCCMESVLLNIYEGFQRYIKFPKAKENSFGNRCGTQAAISLWCSQELITTAPLPFK